MLIAIPIKEDLLDPDFDQTSKVFEVAELDFQNKAIVSRKTIDFSADAQSLTLPELLMRESVAVLVCSEVRDPLYTQLCLAGVEVLSGAPVASPDELYNALIQGTVASGCGCDGCGCGDEEPEQGGGGCGCGPCGCH